ncbi:unnamed protein product [Caenorhabditis brenneri]
MVQQHQEPYSSPLKGVCIRSRIWINQFRGLLHKLFPPGPYPYVASGPGTIAIPQFSPHQMSFPPPLGTVAVRASSSRDSRLEGDGRGGTKTSRARRVEPEQQLHKRGVCTNCPLPILEIKRSTDGRLGTISRCEDCVTLFVWHSMHFDELEKE